MKKALMLTLASAILFLLVGCENTQQPPTIMAVYVGTYTGTWITTASLGGTPPVQDNTNSGTWSIVVDNYGLTSGSYRSTDGFVTETLSGYTGNNGMISTISSGASFTGQISDDGSSVTGTWSDMLAYVSGIFEGTKKASGS